MTTDQEKKQSATHVFNHHHADYLLQRHGTTDLDPLPSADPLDPLNWPTWRKNTYLAIFAFHGMMAGFLAAGLVPASALMADAYGKSLTAVSYLVSAQVRKYMQQLAAVRQLMLTIACARLLCTVLYHSFGFPSWNVQVAGPVSWSQSSGRRCAT